MTRTNPTSVNITLDTDNKNYHLKSRLQLSSAETSRDEISSTSVRRSRRSRSVLQVPGTNAPTSCLSVTKTDFLDPTALTQGAMNSVPRWFYKTDLLVDNEPIKNKIKDSIPIIRYDLEGKPLFLDNGIGSFHSYLSKRPRSFGLYKDDDDVFKSKREDSILDNGVLKQNSKDGALLDSRNSKTLTDSEYHLEDNRSHFKPLVGNIHKRDIQLANDHRNFTRTSHQNHDRLYNNDHETPGRFSEWASLGMGRGKLATDRGSINRPKVQEMSLDERYRLNYSKMRNGTSNSIPSSGHLANQNGAYENRGINNNKREHTTLDKLTNNLERMSQKQLMLKKLLQK